MYARSLTTPGRAFGSCSSGRIFSGRMPTRDIAGVGLPASRCGPGSSSRRGLTASGPATVREGGSRSRGSATKAVCGSSYSSSGSELLDPPLVHDRIRSTIVIASSWSCVT